MPVFGHLLAGRFALLVLLALLLAGFLATGIEAAGVA